MEHLARGPVSACKSSKINTAPKARQGPEQGGLLSGARRASVRSRALSAWNKACSQARPAVSPFLGGGQWWDQVCGRD